MIKLCQGFPIFPAFLAILKIWLFFQNGGDKLYTKAVKHDILSIFERYNNKVTIFQKSQAILTKN